jgi:hypothetical protein
LEQKHVNQFITGGSVRYYTILPESERPAGPARAIAVIGGRMLRRLLEALHESRRRQAALVIMRHRHLLADPETTPPSETKTKNPR